MSKYSIKTLLLIALIGTNIHHTNFALTEIFTHASFDTALKNNNLVIIDFYMPSCGPCKKIAPILDALSQKESSVHFFKVDISQKEFSSIAKKYNIRSVPTLLFVKNGTEIARHIGSSITESELENKIITTFSL